MQPTNYLDSVSKAFAEAKAWKMATLALTVVSVLLTFQLVSQARSRPVVLVPYQAATDIGRVEITTSGELRGTSNEYMANLGLADLGLVLNFNSDNVVTMTKRFLNRTTDALYQAQEAALLARAGDNKQRAVTQSFYPADVRVSADRTRVEVDGLLISSIASRESLRVKVTYVLTYESFKGIPHVSEIRQKNVAK